MARLTPFGAFVTLEEGIDGLLHISKIGQGRRINHPREVLKEGQKLAVTIEEIDPERRRLSLALVSQDAEEDGFGRLRRSAARLDGHLRRPAEGRAGEEKQTG